MYEAAASILRCPN